MVSIMQDVAAGIRVSASGVLSLAAVGLLATNACVAMRRALGRGDAWAAAFAAVAAGLLAALLATVRAHERAGEAGAGAGRRRALLRAAAWAQSAALTTMFAHRVAAVAPDPAVGAVVWGMGGASVAGGFYCLFVRGRGDVDDMDVAGARLQGA